MALTIIIITSTTKVFATIGMLNVIAERGCRFIVGGRAQAQVLAPALVPPPNPPIGDRIATTTPTISTVEEVNAIGVDVDSGPVDTGGSVKSGGRRSSATFDTMQSVLRDALFPLPLELQQVPPSLSTSPTPHTAFSPPNLSPPLPHHHHHHYHYQYHYHLHLPPLVLIYPLFHPSPHLPLNYHYLLLPTTIPIHWISIPSRISSHTYPHPLSYPPIFLLISPLTHTLAHPPLSSAHPSPPHPCPPPLFFSYFTVAVHWTE